MKHFYKCRKSTLVREFSAKKIIERPGVYALFFALYLLCSFPVFAQQSSLLQQKISIKTGRITKAKALLELGRLANCTFSYADDLIKSEELVQLDYRNKPLKVVLKGIVGGTPDLLVQGNTIHIKAVRPPVAKVTKVLKPDSSKVSGNFDLNPVVITGQYRPQTLNKSIYRVEVIGKEQIRNMAVSNVAELLKQQLNIEIENQSGMGRSKIRVLGLNSQYTKILMDNIPIAGDENMGSDVDLTTISLDDVERVEIIKGAMGVEYGANSIAGVINIITKKNSEHKTDLSFEIQEESIRKEYNLSSSDHAKGRHIQKINASHNLTNQLSFGGSVSRDQFNGYRGQYTGAGMSKEMTDKRGYEWSPKTSWNSNVYLSYTNKHFSAFYKFNYFSSDLTNYGHFANGFLLKDEQLYVNASVNNDYRNGRYNHHLNLRGDFWKNAYYTLDASYQKNGLEHRRQAINLEDNSVIDKSNGIPGSEKLQATDWEKYYQSAGVYAKGTFLKPILHKKLDFNAGFEMDRTKGNQGYTNFFNDVSLSSPIENTLFTGSTYTSVEWNLSPKIMIRPGFRLNFSNKLKMRTNQSVTTRYRLNEYNDLRLILGTSTRFPNYEELYSWFVNSIHDYRGNPDLKPEYGKSAEFQWSFRKELPGNIHLETNLSSMFQHITDRIVSTVYRVEGESSLTGRNTYANENKYYGLLNQLDINLVSDKFHFSVGASILGSKGNDGASVDDYNEFLWNTQVNAQFSYLLPAGFRTAFFFRHVGRQPLYEIVATGKGADLQPTGFIKILNKTDAYQNLDFSVAKRFLKNKVDLRLGVKNLFDVTDINYKAVNKPDNIYYSLRTLRLYYGRSYFLRLSYKI
ncbi:TonB-dependent receptor plug domain-containing protein [Pedobacter caeni]|uniref:Outer membrane receptor for ferrienterochelin and colicins n=1 Tax=Pedobacter caeni TaxID=288992 RepID=A0A1M5NE97_9SPHI|nr:TonB-dependent receptor plug domain-containing protein [Pedobacter caeni]SHG87303.1 outer membrane receptor for ferrienterochelin and colicins [Pedobacter caeni]